jgi:hypothetical protein
MRSTASLFLFAGLASGSSVCDPADNANDCTALQAFAKSLNSDGWVKNTHWGSDKSVCGWHGVTCASGRVTEISLEHNKLAGSLPDEIGLLEELQSLDLNGGRPADYGSGGGKLCVGNDFKNASIPAGLYTLAKLRNLNLEYTCTGGTLPAAIGQLRSMVNISLHGNYIGGTIPAAMDQLSELMTFKLGRNPFTGGFPDMRKLSKLIQFNCNFCALSGPVLDIFDHFPALLFSYWDGNGFTGTLPASLGALKNLQRVSFNINNLSGEMPVSWGALADGGVFDDCRIGNDVNLTAYQANYAWMLPVKGNVYKCPLPAYASGSGICNHVTNCADVYNPCSPVTCA